MKKRNTNIVWGELIDNSHVEPGNTDPTEAESRTTEVSRAGLGVKLGNTDQVMQKAS